LASYGGSRQEGLNNLGILAAKEKKNHLRRIQTKSSSVYVQKNINMTWLFMKESCFFVLFNFSHRDLQKHGAFHLIPIGKPLISRGALSWFHNFWTYDQEVIEC
jgi:hypothetical protein